MSNYNSTLQSNNIDLQAILNSINELPEAGGEPILQDKTITPSTNKQNITADSGYDGLDTVTVNAIPTAAQATPTVSINISTGLITATATQTAGYVAAGIKSATHQLAFQPAQTITPTTTNQTIPANTYLGGVQTIKGDANLVASNIVSGKSIFGVVGTATAGGSSGDTNMEDTLITRTLINYTNDSVTSIGSYAFYRCSNLTSVNFPVVTTIGIGAFGYCSKLTSVNFPVATTIGRDAFQFCSNLTSVNFPVVTTIDSCAFQYCPNLTSVNFPVVTTIGSSAFQFCSNLTSVNFSAVTTIGSYVFYYCSNLTSVNFPVVTTIGIGAFGYCSKLTSVNFPVATTIGSYAFQNCSNLTSVNFPVVTTIGIGAFQYCSKLVSIYLRASSVCQLSNSNAFLNTGIWSTKGSIFVPTSLVASYKAATNWAYFSKRIFGI